MREQHIGGPLLLACLIVVLIMYGSGVPWKELVSAALLWALVFGPVVLWALVSTHRDAKKYNEVEFMGRTFRVTKTIDTRRPEEK